MEKAEAREIMRIRRRALAGEERKALQCLAQKHLWEMPEFQQAEWIFPFVSCRTEIDTIHLIQCLLKERRHSVAVPRVQGSMMEFVAIHSMEDLAPGAMQILEPSAGTVVSAEEGVMLMPGLAFDLLGNRVGYGAGYYDRYLGQHDHGGLYKIAYAFDFQVVDQIVTGEYDRKVDAIVTDGRILYLSQNNYVSVK